MSKVCSVLYPGQSCPPPLSFLSSCVAAFRPAVACLVAISLFRLYGEAYDFFEAGFIGIAIAVVVAGTCTHIGIAIGMAIRLTAGLGAATLFSSLLCYGFSRASDNTYKVANPFIAGFFAFVFKLVFGGGSGVSSMIFYIDWTGPIRQPQDERDDWAPMKVWAAASIAVVLGMLCQLLPLPYGGRRTDTPCPMPSSAALRCWPLLAKARSLTSSLVRALAHSSLASPQDLDTLPVEMIQAQLTETLSGLAALLPTAGMELKLCFCSGMLLELQSWVKLLQSQQQALRLMKLVVANGPALGGHREISEMTSDTVLELTALISDVTNPSSPLPDDAAAQLSECTARLASAFQAALNTIARMSEAPHGAEMMRRSAFMAALLKLARTTANQVSKLSDPEPPAAPQTGMMVRVASMIGVQLDMFNPSSVKRAAKFSLMVAVASLWISVDALWNRTSGHGNWVGITVSVINLTNTSTSFHKAKNRLAATLLACTLGVLLSNITKSDTLEVGQLPDVNKWYVIFVLVLWTFACFLLRQYTTRNVYVAQCSATTAILLLYEGTAYGATTSYVINRIAMIMYGVLIFTFIELAILPDSPRSQFESEVPASLARPSV